MWRAIIPRCKFVSLILVAAFLFLGVRALLSPGRSFLPRPAASRTSALMQTSRPQRKLFRYNAVESWTDDPDADEDKLAAAAIGKDSESKIDVNASSVTMVDVGGKLMDLQALSRRVDQQIERRMARRAMVLANCLCPCCHMMESTCESPSNLLFAVAFER